MPMRALSLLLLVIALVTGASCSNNSPYSNISFAATDGERVEFNQNTPLTLLFFFSMSNPVAIGEFKRLSESIYIDGADIIAVAMDVDRPPNVAILQQETLIPVAIDDQNRISSHFGGVELTPALLLLKNGKVLQRQSGAIDYESVNAQIVVRK